MKIKLLRGDCLVRMDEIEDSRVSLILCDLPYGTTRNKWDSVINLKKLWRAYNRILAPSGAIVLTASQPFSSTLVSSNPEMFKYEWIWRKSRVTGVLNAKHQPLRQHEVVLVFAKGKTVYNAQGLIDCNKRTGTGRTNGKASSGSENYGAIKATEDGKYLQTKTGWPRSVLDFASVGKTVHPTQKPVDLMEYLVRTYTNDDGLVLDNTMGSGTTGVACVNARRSFIGIERDPTYFEIASSRVKAAIKESKKSKPKKLFAR